MFLIRFGFFKALIVKMFGEKIGDLDEGGLEIYKFRDNIYITKSIYETGRF